MYTTRRPAALDLYLFEPKSSVRQITDGHGDNYDATFSPDGRWIVFASERQGEPHLYVIDLRHPAPPMPLTTGAFMDAAPAFTPDGETLLFVSDRDGNADVFSIQFRPDDPEAAGQARNLTHHPGGNFRPAVSPDGKTIAFSSDRYVDFPIPFEAEIYAMDRDGSNPRRLTTLKAMSGSPIWSRDGHTIFFYSNARSEGYRVWAMSADGTGQRALTPKSLSALSPALMPNGRIAFIATRSGDSAIMSVGRDGSGLRPEQAIEQSCRGLAFDPGSERWVCTGAGSLAGMEIETNGLPIAAPGTAHEVRLPDRILEMQGVHELFCSISPDGREFVAGQYPKAGVLDDMSLVISHLDGSGKRQVFRPPTSMPVWATSWARHADLIAFTVGPIFAPDDAVVDIWTVHSDGSHATNLTQGKFRNNSFPELTPEGRQIVFRSTRDGGKNIYIMNADGTDVRRVTNDSKVDTMPTISPSGDVIAYSGGGFRLYLQRLKDGAPVGAPQLFQDFSPSVHPHFSPDGKWIAFASRRAWLNDEAALSSPNSQPYGEIFAAPVDGSSTPIRLTHNRWEDSVPCWGLMPSS
jgi:Tol biopolymer transport system component